MKNNFSTSYHSPEKIFCALSVCLLIIGAAYVSHRIYLDDRDIGIQLNLKADSDHESTAEIDDLKWLMPFKAMNYQHNPFDVSLKLNVPKPKPKPKPVQPPPPSPVTPKPPKQTAPVQPPAPPVKTFLIEYRGNYTNLAGINYAMLSVTNVTQNSTETKIMVKGESFLKVFRLEDFSDTTATISIRNQPNAVIPWNEKKEVKLQQPGGPDAN